MHTPPLSSTRPCVFFDDARGILGPLTSLRASFEIRTGAFTSAQRLVSSLGLEPIAVYAPTGIAGIVSQRWSVPVNAMPESLPGEPVLVINGRCPLPLDVLRDIEPGQAAVEEGSGDLICARLNAAEVVELLAGQDPTREKITVHDRVLLARPWDVIAHRNRTIEHDLHVLGAGPTREPTGAVFILGEHPVRVDPSARVAPGVTLDATDGPVVIERHATLKSGAVIVGPAVIGPSCVITENGIVRANSAIGPVCKVGGEVGGVIFQGYANKAHEGYLGDSFVGEWVNLGAGTVSSNLLNTYSEISAVAGPGLARERTELQFFGCILGDHTKTAIATRIMTGAVVGTGVMWAATPPMTGCVPAFAWVTDSGQRLTRLGKFLEVATTVMARRDIEPSDAYLQQLEALHRNADQSQV
jgi:UDP-N-acetylglucosamine diphosphorylase/glucosamine-1-phosphate N-acetyltransferase